MRSKYQRLFKALAALLTHLARPPVPPRGSAPTDNANNNNTAGATEGEKVITKVDDKVAKLEEKVTLAVKDLQKYKEKRQRETTERLKREEEKEKKRKEKEEENEKKKKQKEESDRLKKEEQEKAAALKLQLKREKEEEKEKKKREEEEKKREEEEKKLKKLEKQQSFFKNFLVKPAGGSTSSTATTAASPASDKPLAVSSVGTTSTPPRATTSSTSSATSAAATTANTTAAVVDLAAEDEKFKSYWERIRNGSSSSTSSSTSAVEREKEREAERQRQKALRRAKRQQRPRHISVPVTVLRSQGTARAAAVSFGDDTDFCEIETRVFVNRRKVFAFSEDRRPAYSGTFSKRSLVISGRRPFQKDDTLIRYDLDSEEEWEEDEGEGEDIVESDNEDDEDDEDEDGQRNGRNGPNGANNNNNDLVYDDFFRRDGDFGSDLDSDLEDEVLALQRLSTTTVHRQREEIVGPRFLALKSNNTRESAASVSVSVSVSVFDRATLHGAYSVRCRPPSDPSDPVTPTTRSDLVSVSLLNDDDSQALSVYTAHVFVPHRQLCLLATPRSAQTATAATAAGQSGETTEEKKKGAKKGKKVEGEAINNAQSSSSSSSSSSASSLSGLTMPQFVEFISVVQGSREGIDKLVQSVLDRFTLHSLLPLPPKALVKRCVHEVAEKVQVSGEGVRWVVHSVHLQRLPVEIVNKLWQPKLKKATLMKATPAVLKTKKAVGEVTGENKADGDAAVNPSGVQTEAVTVDDKAAKENRENVVSSEPSSAAEPVQTAINVSTKPVKKRVTPILLTTASSPAPSTAPPAPSTVTGPQEVVELLDD